VYKAIQEAFLNPIKSFKLKYLPLLMIYFSYGASGFASIAESFWVKESINLTAKEFVALGVWLSLPWTIKMVFGQFVDSIKIFGSNRKIYVYIGASFVTVGILLFIGLTGNYDYAKFSTPENVYILANFFSVIGFVIQDVVADAMSTEVVDRTKSKEEVQRELAMVQVLGRLSLSIAMFLVAGIGGWLAQIYSYETIFIISLFIPILSIVGVTAIKLQESKTTPIDCKILCGGIGFAIFIIFMGFSDIAYSQEIVFVVSLFIISLMIKEVIHELDENTKRVIIFAAIIIFVYRATPSVGPGMGWWEIDVLGFDKAFFGTLAQIGAGLAIVGMWLLSDFITKKPVSYTLILLTIVSTILSFPMLGLYYGLAEHTAQFGIDARDIAIIDTAVSSPFAHLSMIPLLTLIAIYAPEGHRATWFALMASLMNLALTAGAMFTKYLNELFIITRELKDKSGALISSADYSQLGDLMIVVISIGFFVPIIVIYILRKKIS
jgi:hypothetical protein